MYHQTSNGSRRKQKQKSTFWQFQSRQKKGEWERKTEKDVVLMSRCGSKVQKQYQTELETERSLRVLQIEEWTQFVSHKCLMENHMDEK